MLPVQRNKGSNLANRGEYPLDELRRKFNRLWNNWLTPFEDFGSTRTWDLGMEETDKEIVVRADVPGFEENELNVRLDSDVLTIEAEKEQKEQGREQYRSFYRAVALPAGINPDQASATYRNGVLELHFPRSEGTHVRRIPIGGQQAELSQTAKQPEEPAAKQPEPAATAKTKAAK